MYRFLLVLMLLASTGLSLPAAAQTGAAGLPPRPAPFKFVNDQGQLMSAADAKKLEGGLRRYADNTGTQVVVVTVPSLGGREVADYGRALGTAWGVGQRDKNNGVVVLVSAQERKVTIQPGSGLASTITPAVTQRIIGQMAPSFKQGNYFAGLRTGLNTLMVTANPSSAPQKSPAETTSPGSAAAGAASATAVATAPANLEQSGQAPASGNDPIMARPPAEPVSSGPGMGTLLLGALAVGAVLWFVVRMFRNRNSAAAPAAPSQANAAPNFLPNQPTGPVGGNNPRQAPGNYGPGYGNAPNQNQGGGLMGGGGGMGMGGMLATGAAAAAGAYLGNRMASGHDTSGNSLGNEGSAHNADSGTAAGAGLAGAGAGAAGTGAASDYFSTQDNTAADNAAPDYFSADESAADNTSGDYFTDDSNSSYDDQSSGDSGGGGFDSDNDNSGSW